MLLHNKLAVVLYCAWGLGNQGGRGVLPLDSIVSSLELAWVGVAGGSGKKGCVSFVNEGGREMFYTSG